MRPRHRPQNTLANPPSPSTCVIWSASRPWFCRGDMSGVKHKRPARQNFTPPQVHQSHASDRASGQSQSHLEPVS
eukprot:1160791-Pelagomonas_calceolata.AAC.10